MNLRGNRFELCAIIFCVFRPLLTVDKPIDSHSTSCRANLSVLTCFGISNSTTPGGYDVLLLKHLNIGTAIVLFKSPRSGSCIHIKSTQRPAELPGTQDNQNM